MNDKEQLKADLEAVLNLLGHCRANGVVEVTTFSQDSGKPKLVGYFEDTARAATEIARYDGRDNIYISLNPVKRDLLARANNRLAPCKNRIADKDVLFDSWFFIDIDPERPSGISSTDDELDAALGVQMDVRDWLIQKGVPPQSMVTAVSGNGAYILVKLPNYSVTPELVEAKKRLLKYISERFSTKEVKVDDKVYNPARLMAAIGTQKRKGDETSDRPHRRSHIYRVAGQAFDPKQSQEVVPFDLYSLVADLLPKQTAQPRSIVQPQDAQGRFDMRAFAPSLPGYKESDSGWAYAKCPAHNGNGCTSLQVNLETGAYVCQGGCTTGQIRQAIGAPKVQPTNIHTPSAHEFPTPFSSWPAAPEQACLHGLAGEIVGMIYPHSEADLSALLVQFLVAFGNIIGRSAHFVAEADAHYLNLFAVLVGPSSKGRKGTSWSQIRRLFSAADANWENCVQSGLSSGEGLIWAVRDPISKHEPIKEKGRIVDYQEVITDPGIEDKRLLAIESEFASTLRAIGREGNTLSALVRQAWDNGNLRVLTKNSPAQSTGAHISIIGHITKDELRRYLDSTEVGNGFANRFLWPCVKRSKSLPEGGRLHEVDFFSTIRRLSDVIEFARSTGEMRRDEEARKLWFDAYGKLSEGKPGLLGAVTSRGEAQVMRMACIYALLDKSAIVRKPHLEAALALWKYCEDSAQFIFGDSLGDPLADELLRTLRGAETGMTRTDISNLFGRNRKSQEIGRALSTLAEAGLIHRVVEQSDGPGRPSERWVAIQTVPCTLQGSNERNDENERINESEDSSFNSLFSLSNPGAIEGLDEIATLIM
ncbi:MAG: DUF3987 domain-containing protein [Blastocatellia bacterium]